MREGRCYPLFELLEDPGEVPSCGHGWLGFVLDGDVVLDDPVLDDPVLDDPDAVVAVTPGEVPVVAAPDTRVPSPRPSPSVPPVSPKPSMTLPNEGFIFIASPLRLFTAVFSSWDPVPGTCRCRVGREILTAPPVLPVRGR